MAQTLTYWDPKNLLQITNDDKSDDIQCVGQDRHGKRCKWDIQPHVRPTVYALLAEMSRKKPSEVSTAEVLRLAPLCLCENYHQRQIDAVTSRWAVVITTAMRHYDLAAQQQQHQQQHQQPQLGGFGRFSREPTPESEEAISLKLDLHRAREEMDAAKQANDGLRHDLTREREEANAAATANKALRVDLAAAQQERSNAFLALAAMGERIRRLESESTHLLEQIQRATHEKSVLEERAKTAGAEATRLSSAQLALEEENKALQARFQSAEDRLRHRDAQMKELAEALSTEAGSINDHNFALHEIEQLKADCAAAHNESHRLAQKLEESTQSEQRSRAELEESRNAEQRLRIELEESRQAEKQFQEELERSKRANQVYRSELGASRQSEQQARTELETSRQSEQQARIDLEASRRAEQQSLTELEASRHAEQRSRAELDNVRGAKAALESQFATLQSRVGGLEESITACWLHGFCGRMNRLRRSRKRDPPVPTLVDHVGAAQPRQ